MCAPAALSLGAPPHSSAGDWQHPRHKGSAGGAEEATTGTHARASRGFCWRPRGERGAARGEDGALHEVLQHSRLRTPKSRAPTNSFVGADRRTGRGTGESLAGGSPHARGDPDQEKGPPRQLPPAGRRGQVSAHARRARVPPRALAPGSPALAAAPPCSARGGTMRRRQGPRAGAGGAPVLRGVRGA